MMAAMTKRRSGLPVDAHASRRAIAYRRVSTGDQVTSGLGLEAQTRAIDEHAKRHGLLVVERFSDEGVSGGRPLTDRPQLLAAIQALGDGDTLLVARLDRLSRGEALEQAVIDELVERRGARIISCSGEGTAGDSPTDTFVRHLLRLVARFGRDLIRARTKAALAAKKARGERVGALPYGQTDDERRVLNLIRTQRAGGASLKEAADALNAHGLTTRRGTPWRPQYVASLLKTASGAARPVPSGRRRHSRAALEVIAAH